VAWVILLLVLLAAAFGVLGAVIEAAAFLVLTVLLTIAVLGTIAWYALRRQLRRWQREATQGSSRLWVGGRTRGTWPRDLPTHDDRY
jgi:cytochrome c biogenesis protein ResB